MSRWPYLGPGIHDDYFQRSQGIPMTKQEIRTLALSKLRLFSDCVVYDLGAGSGSVSIECKLLAPDARIFAVEKDPRAIELIRENANAFNVQLEVVAGNAPECLRDLPPADRIFLGGSGGQLESILKYCDYKLQPGGWIVMNSVSLDNSFKAGRFFKDQGYNIETIMVNISHSQLMGATEIWQARNPVTIMAACKEITK